MRLVIEEAESYHNYNIIQQVINQPIIHILNNFLSVSSENGMSHASPDQNMLKGSVCKYSMGNQYRSFIVLISLSACN